MHLKGYNGTGIKEIVDAAGVPKGSFYNYFDSKEDFAIQLLNAYADVSCAETEQFLLDTTYPPVERIKRLYLARLEYVEAKVNCTPGCFVNGLCQEMADVNPVIGGVVDDTFNRFRDTLAICIAEAQQAGDIRLPHEATILAEFIENSWRGAMLAIKARHNTEPLNAFKTVLFEVILQS